MGSRMSEVINVKELSLSDINEMLKLLESEKMNREDEEKNEAIQNFYNAWLRLRELGITPSYLSRENVSYDSDYGVYYMNLDNFEDFEF